MADSSSVRKVRLRRGLVALVLVGLAIVVVTPGSPDLVRLVAVMVLTVAAFIVGLVVVASAAMLGQKAPWAGRRPMEQQWSTLGGRPAWMLPVRSHGLVLIVTCIVAGLALVGVVAAVEPNAGVGLFIVIGLPLLSMVPDTIGALRSGAGLVMSQDLVELRAWDRTTGFAWDDVEHLDVETTAFGPVLVFLVDTTSPDFSTRDARRIWRFGPDPTSPRFDFPIGQIGRDWDDLVRVVRMFHEDPATRAQLSTPP